MSRLGAVLERKAQTVTHSNPLKMLYGTVTGTTITFGFKFVSAPTILLTPLAATGSPIATVVSKDTTDGYYTGATIVMTGATSVDWIAIGTGIGT
jgi:hypothetical protein